MFDLCTRDAAGSEAATLANKLLWSVCLMVASSAVSAGRIFGTPDRDSNQDARNGGIWLGCRGFLSGPGLENDPDSMSLFAGGRTSVCTLENA